MKKYLLLYSAIFLNLFFVVGQEIGKPFFRNFKPTEYQGDQAIWSFYQDARGIVYVATGGSILEYDGRDWHKIADTGGGTIRFLEGDSVGTLYYASDTDLGVLTPNASGRWEARSLKKELSPEMQTFTRIMRTFVMPEGVYFQATEWLALWNGRKFTNVWYPPHKEKFNRMFRVENKLYVQEIGHGLYTLEKGNLHFIAQSQRFVNERFHFMLPYDQYHFLLGSRTHGLFLYNHQTTDTASIFKPFVAQTSAFFIENNIYDGIPFSENEYLIGTFRSGAVVMDKDGTIKRIFSRKQGLNDAFATCFLIDKNKTVWIGLFNGLAHAELFSPFSFYDEWVGIEGGVYRTIRHKQNLYIGTLQGVSLLQNGRFELVKGGSVQCFNLTEVQGRLWAGLLDGIYEIEGNAAKPLFLTPQVMYVKPLENDKNRVFVKSRNELLTLVYKNGKWISEGLVSFIKEEISNIKEDQNKNIWIATLNGIVYKIENTPEKEINKRSFVRYDSTHGLPAHKGIALEYIGGRMVFSCSEGRQLFYFDENKSQFIPNFAITTHLADGSKSIYSYESLRDGKFWIKSSFGDAHLDMNIYYPTPQGTFYTDTLLFKTLGERDYFSVYEDNNQVFWIGSSENFIRYDAHYSIKYAPNFQTLIRKVVANGDSILFHGLHIEKAPPAYTQKTGIAFVPATNQQTNMPALPYAFNSLYFYFSANEYSDESSIQYSYFLDGYDEKWSSWGKETKKEYTNLPEGNYCFYAKARNKYGVESVVAKYEYQILPPWYREKWVFFLYTLLGVGIVIAAVKVYSLKLEQEKYHLENLIQQRTEEISNKNKEILEKNAELEQQKEEIAVQHEYISEAYTNIKHLSLIGQRITSSLTIETIAHTIYQYAEELLDTSFFAIGLSDAAQEQIHIIFCLQEGKIITPKPILIADNSSFMAFSWREGKDITNEFLEKVKTHLQLSGEYAGVLCLPLRGKNQNIGIICVQSPNPKAYTHYHLSIFKNIAVYAAIAFENAEAYQEIAIKNKEIESQHTNITASINYAKRMQIAILPNESIFRSVLHDVFILFRPRDIVSGDFYWFAKQTQEGHWVTGREKTQENDTKTFKKIIIAVADCTGHGVPGALMSVIGDNLLKNIILGMNISQPDLILNQLHKGVFETLNQHEGSGYDGMDIVICLTDIENQKIQFSGAVNPLICIKNASISHQKELMEYKGDNLWIGGTIDKIRDKERKTYTLQEFPLEKDMVFYAYSDGFQDQFGGEENKKFKTKRFKETLLSLAHLPLHVQKEKLIQIFEDWKGKQEQIDDILVMGWKITKD